MKTFGVFALVFLLLLLSKTCSEASEHALSGGAFLMASSTSDRFTVQQLRTKCILQPYEIPRAGASECKVEAFALQTINNSLPGRQVAYQQTYWTESYGEPIRRYSLFHTVREMDDKFQAIWTNIGRWPDWLYFVGEQSGILGDFIVVKGVSGADGHGVDFYTYNVSHGGQLVQFDAQSWQHTQILSLLPKGFWT